ncbi:MAG: MATE family efflux transporter [Polyangiales bacterium]
MFGAGQLVRAKRAGGSAYMAQLVTAALSLVYVLFSAPIIRFFDPADNVMQIGQQYLLVVAGSYAFFASAIVLSQAMTGAGATFSSLVLDICVVFGIVVPAGYVVAITLDLPKEILWATVALSNLVTFVVFAIYYARGRFLRKKLKCGGFFERFRN